jgi:hypothetical protein
MYVYHSRHKPEGPSILHAHVGHLRLKMELKAPEQKDPLHSADIQTATFPFVRFGPYFRTPEIAEHNKRCEIQGQILKSMKLE